MTPTNAPPKKKTTTSASEEELLKQAQNVQANVQGQKQEGELEQAMAGVQNDKNNVTDNVTGNVDSNVPNVPEAGMKETLYSLVKVGVGIAHEKWDWSDPGDEWKRGVAELASIVATKYIGSMAETYSTEGALIIMVGSWVLMNVQEKGVPKFFRKPKPATLPNEQSDVAQGDGVPGSDRFREVDEGARAA